MHSQIETLLVTTGLAGQGSTLPMPPTMSTDSPAMDLIRRWMELSEMERRTFVALTRELTNSSTLVETSTLDLSARFQELAMIAQAQTGQVANIIAVAGSIDVDGEPVPLNTAMEAVESVLLKIIETILSVSKHAMRMVYALDSVAQDVNGAEQCASQIARINTQTRYLALNAAIEASRAGSAGAAFGVIAYEMKNLSLATEATSIQVHDRIASITKGVRKSHDVLKGIATLDMSEHIMAKDRLDSLIAGIIAQNKAFNLVLAEAASSSALMSGTVGQLITGMQFQDRTKQHIGQIIDTLAVLAESTETLQQATCAEFPGAFQAGAIDQVHLNRIIERQTLGGMKQRVLDRLLNGAPDDDVDSRNEIPGSAGHSGAGDVELF